MKRMRLSEIIAAVDGSPAAASTDDPAITGVCTDSRKVEPGELFVPLCGEHHDGHDFIAGAFERGAAASLSSRDASAGSGRRIVKVSDTLTALEDLALYNRGELSFEVTAITGSVVAFIETPRPAMMFVASPVREALAIDLTGLKSVPV